MTSKNLPANNLKEVRTQNNATQAQIADFLGVTAKTYRGYEKGQEYPKLESLIALSDRWGVSIDYLLGRSDFTTDGNEYISSVTGLSDGSINQLRKVALHDNFLQKSNDKNDKRNDNLSVRPVLHSLRIPIINFILESKSFINLINDFIYYLDSDRFTNLLDGTFHKLPTKEIIPADNDLIAGGVMIQIDSDTNKALAKNLLDIRLEKLSQEYKNK